jgi:hypothetical protein
MEPMRRSFISTLASGSGSFLLSIITPDILYNWPLAAIVSIKAESKKRYFILIISVGVIRVVKFILLWQ